MKPYGVRVVEFPDVADIQAMGAKSSAGRFPEKGGDYRGYNRSSKLKKAIRRYWKKKARQNQKGELNVEND